MGGVSQCQRRILTRLHSEDATSSNPNVQEASESIEGRAPLLENFKGSMYPQLS